MPEKSNTLRSKYVFIVLFAILISSIRANAYSLLTHEAIIDVSWKKSIEPLLLKKYPGSSAEELVKAHAHAYGGAVMPDIGYSPFGSMLYTNLVHNVSSGDYIQALLDEAQNLNEYAFALGSLSHYMADVYGHSIGTNIAVPATYEKLRAEFGDMVTYADHHKSHSRVEVSFDVLQTARGNYATKAYHDFIGFDVSREVVERAFFKTYGLQVTDVFRSLPLAISTYRWVIKSLLPNIVRAAWATKKSALKQAEPGINAQKFSFKMKNSTYYHQYGRDLQKAGFIPTIVSFIIPILPKLGPLSKLKYKPPSAEAERLFIKSFDSTLVNYQAYLEKLNSKLPHLTNKTLDTGGEAIFGKYSITDESHADLLLKLQKKNFENLSPLVARNLLGYYKNANPVWSKKRDLKKWSEIKTALDGLNEFTSE